MPALQEYYNSLGTKKKTTSALQDYYTELADKGKEKLYKAKMKGSKIDRGLHRQLLKRGATSEQIQSIEPEKTSLLKSFGEEFFKTKPVQTALSATNLLSKMFPQPSLGVLGKLRGKTTKEEAKEVVSGTLDTVRASTQLLASPFAFLFGLKKGGATPTEGLTESLEMAKDMWIKEDVNIGENVEKAADMYLKSQKVGKYGNEEVGIKDVAVLSFLGFANIFGDPVFEVGIGLKGAKALKEFATFKKVGKVTKEFEAGSKIIKGTEIPREIKITEDLKIKIKPKTKEVVLEGYKRRFPKQKALPEGKLADDTTELIMQTRETTGMEMVAKFQGDNLILKATTPIKKAGQPVAKTTQIISKEQQPLYEEAKKYETAEEFKNSLYDRDFPGEPLKTKVARNFIEEQRIEFIRQPNELRKAIDELGVIFSKDNGAVLPPKSLEQFFNGKEKLKKIDLEGVFNQVKGEVAPKDNQPLAEEAKKYKSAEEFVKAKALPEVSKQPPVKELTYKPTIKTSGLAKSVKRKAIRDKMIYAFDKDFRNLPDYDKRIKTEDTAKATDYVLNDTGNAIKVAMGEIKPPTGMLPEDIFVAVNKYATAIGDVGLIAKLINKSSLIGEATFMGQRIQALSELSPYSPSKILQNIKKTREKAVKSEKKVKEKLTEEQKKINREIRAVKKSQKDLDDFVKSIIC